MKKREGKGGGNKKDKKTGERGREKAVGKEVASSKQ